MSSSAGDLVDRERERRAAEVDDLALAAEPLDRRTAARSATSRGRAGSAGASADQRLDEPPRAGRAGEDVEIVEDEHEIARERDLQRVGHECRGGRRLGR